MPVGKAVLGIVAGVCLFSLLCIGTPVIIELWMIRSLRIGTSNQRTSAVQWLTSNQSQRSAAALCERLQDLDAERRLEMLRALTSTTLQDAVIAQVRNLLRDIDSRIRCEAILTLGNQRRIDSQLVIALCRSLDDQDANVRRVAVRVLGSLGRGAPAALSFLMQLSLDDKESIDIRLLAVEAVIDIHGPMPSLLPVVTHGIQDTRHEVRSQAISVLRLFERCGIACEAILRDALKDIDEGVRTLAVLALRDVGAESKETVRALTNAMQDPSTRYWAIVRLGEIGDGAKESLPLLREILLSRGSDDIQRAATVAIERIEQSVNHAE